MKVLIVYAHPEPDSFGGAMLRTALQALESDGHEVRVSDLYGMGFEPVASAADFQQRRFPDRLQYDREQKLASEKPDGFSPDIRAELDKLLWCDHLVFQFPLWWFSVPAILKGWIDRVLANGTAYGQGKRLDTGGLKGRRAMLAFSTGCFEDMMAPDGLLGGLDIVLWHLHAGTFRYCGLTCCGPSWLGTQCSSIRPSVRPISPSTRSRFAQWTVSSRFTSIRNPISRTGGSSRASNHGLRVSGARP